MIRSNLFFQIANPSDDDLDITLTGLSANECSSQEDGGDFKNIINTSTNKPVYTVAKKNANSNSNSSDNITDVVISSSNGVNRKRLLSILGEYFTAENKLCASLQGSCSDGEYFYYSFIVNDRSSTGAATYMGNCIVSCKYEDSKMMTKKIVTSNNYGCQDLVKLAHANDIAYNEKENVLVVTCCSSTSVEEKHQYICKMNANFFKAPEDLEANADKSLNFSKHAISCMASSIAYNSSIDRYVVTITGQYHYFAILDHNFNMIGLINKSSKTAGGTNTTGDITREASVQGISCDDNYIYVTYYIDEKENDKSIKVEEQNTLIILDWQGNVVREIGIKIPLIKYNNISVFYEVEDIIISNDKVLLTFDFYCKANSTDNDGSTRRPRYYYCDISSEFFNIEFRADSDVSANRSKDNIRIQNILSGNSTEIFKNKFIHETENEIQEDGTVKVKGKEFVGWNLYWVEQDKWYCILEDGSKGWRKVTTNENGEDNYVKVIYNDKTRVSKTVKKGEKAIFCAVWQTTDAFNVAFDLNCDENITLPSQSIVYGQSTTLSKNTLTDTASAFQGWNAYCVETGKWYYKNKTTGVSKWFYEDCQDAGYTKYVYKDGAIIKQTAKPGMHVIMFAVWNEFTIMYDANGLPLSADSLQSFVAKRAIINQSNNLSNISSIYRNKDQKMNGVNASFSYYAAFRIDINKLRAYDSAQSKYAWIPYDDYCMVNDSLYNYQQYNSSTTVTKTGGAGERVVFKAIWTGTLIGKEA